VNLPEDVPGRLWLHSIPGRFEPMVETQQQLAEHRISQVLCLTPLEEIATKSPYAAAEHRLDADSTLTPQEREQREAQVRAVHAGVQLPGVGEARGQDALQELRFGQEAHAW